MSFESADKAKLFHLIDTILRLSKKSQRLWIEDLSTSDTRLLRQIAYNILFNSSLELSEKDLKYFRRRLEVLRQLASRRVTVKDKQALLKQNPFILHRLAGIAKAYFS